MDFSWDTIARTVAPTVATALGGPLAGIAANLVASALLGPPAPGTPPSTPAAVKQLIATSTSPEALANLKQAELALKKLEADNDFKFADLDARDAVSARSMRVDALRVGSRTADVLSYLVLGAFAVTSFSALVGCYLVLTHSLVVTQANATVWVASSGLVGTIVGYFASNAGQVVSFHFGSSAGSADKTHALGDQLDAQTSAIATALTTTATTTALTAGTAAGLVGAAVTSAGVSSTTD